jgi:predicted small lipoprotein YifL
MRRITKLLGVSVLLAMTLSACGVKGPLYIPEKKYPQNVSLQQLKVASYLLIINAV